MSVLAALIGILTLLIAANMLANAKKQEGLTQEEYDKARKYKELKLEEKELLAKKEKINEILKTEQKALFALNEVKDKSIILKKKLAELESKETDITDAQLQKEIELMQDETVVLKEEQPDLQAKIKELEALLKERKNQKPKESVVIIPPKFGSDVPKNLFFVECTSTGIKVQATKKNPEFTVSTAAINVSNEYARFCQEVNDTKDSMVLFLVRKTGYNNFLWGASYAETKFELRTGKLPVPNDGELDLSLFKKKSIF